MLLARSLALRAPGKAMLFCGALLALSAGVASAAAGVNLRWNSCLGDGGVIVRTSACNANTGSNVLAASFELLTDLPHGFAVGVRIDLVTCSASLPAWWDLFNAGTCRPTSLTAAGLGGNNCPDWDLGLASVSIAGYNEGNLAGGPSSPNTADINIASAVQLGQVQDLFAGREYGVVKVTINNLKTVGTGSCAGCTTPACILNQSVDMFSSDQNGSVHFLMSGPTNGTDSNFVLWQGGCLRDPTRRSSWGALKGLYR